MLHGKLTHWGRVTHICVSNLTIIGSDNGLSPGRRQAIIGTSIYKNKNQHKNNWWVLQKSAGTTFWALIN